MTHRTDQPLPAGSRRTLALVVVLLAAFMDLLDSTIVNVALPPVQWDLGASFAQVQWVVAAYLLGFAVLLITGGRLGDIAGRKRMFLIGVAGFTAASALCGVAGTAGQLIAFRALQGAGAALMVPQVLAIVTTMFPPAQRGAALGAFGALAGLATVGGPVLGAVLTDADLFGWGWRSIFVINVPVGVLAFAAALVVVRESRSPRALRLDPSGVALLTAALLLLLVPLVQGRELGWPGWTFASMALAAAVFAVLIRGQLRRTAAGRSPLIVMTLFRSRSFGAGLAANLVFFVLVTGYFLIFTLYLQAGLGYSVLKAGLTGIPWSFGTSFAAAVSATVLVPRLGRRVLVLGAVLLGAGLVGIIVTTQVAGAAVTPWQLLPATLAGGLGMGMIVAPILDFILSDVPAGDAGSGSGLVNAMQQVGGAIGVAVLGVVFFGQLSAQAGPQADAVAPALRAELREQGVTAGAAEQIVAGMRRCFTERVDDYGGPEPAGCRQATAGDARTTRAVVAAADQARRQTFAAALRSTLWVEAGLAVLTLLLILRLPRQARHHDEAGPEPRPVPAGSGATTPAPLR
ncbi:MFS transporter [Actinoplanes sp. RD1]|uniref:MFS transporter n=1 Tax=Actinoplanes sp. RD1 TaxID=3064538 RepID=UPI0027421E23|nr:MFS transporter [Actinoplanes sp. RD1]